MKRENTTTRSDAMESAASRHKPHCRIQAKAQASRDRCLLVCDCGAGRTCQGADVDLAEAHLATPAGVIAACVIEGVAELDQHVERHHQPERVLAASIVDQELDCDQRASVVERLV